MDVLTGRPDELGDAVSAYHMGAWFHWTDVKNKTYANLQLADKVWNSDGTALIDNPITKLPTEAELNAKLAAMQDVYDKKNQPYILGRNREFPHLRDQLSMIYDDIENGTLDKTGSFYKSIKSVKDKYPKS